MTRGRSWLRWALVATALVLVAGAVRDLAGPRPVGRADNCDFARVMYAAGLAHVDYDGAEPACHERLNERFRRRFTRLAEPAPMIDGQTIPTAIVGRAAVTLSGAWSADAGRAFDIAWYSLLQLAVVVGLLFTGFRGAEQRRWLLAAGLLFVVTEYDHLSFLNSFFAEGTAVVLAIALCAVVGLHARRRGALVLAAVLALALSMAKHQYVACSLVFAGTLLAHAIFARKRGRARWPALALALALGLAGPLYWSWLSPKTPNSWTVINRFNAVSVGVLDETTPEERARLVARLGIGPEMESFAGRTIYQASHEGPRPLPPSARWMRATPARVAAIYATEPRRLAWAVRQLAWGMRDFSDVGKLSSPAIHEPPDSTGPQRPTRRLAAARAALFGVSPWVGLGVLVLGAVVGLRQLRRDASAPIGLTLLAASALSASQIAACIVGEGRESLVRHLALARVCFDVVVVVLLVEIVIHESGLRAYWRLVYDPPEGGG